MSKGYVTFGLLLMVVGTAAWYSVHCIGNVEASFVACKAVSHAHGSELGDWIRLIPAIESHSDLIVSWTVAIAGGIVGLIVLPGLDRFKSVRWLYLLLAPALTLLMGALWLAIDIRGRAEYLELNNCPDLTHTINDVLLAQTQLFHYALAILMVFAAACLTEHALGSVRYPKDNS